MNGYGNVGSRLRLGLLICLGVAWIGWNQVSASEDDKKLVAELDAQYQAAVQKNDAATMDKLLADDFILVTGKGKTYTKSDLLKQARGGQVVYEQQDDTDQTVRVWGDTAVITARLRAKGNDRGNPFEYTLWFSDTYVR